VDAALAEFQALRAEIISNLNSQAALVGLSLTAVGVIVGLTVKEGGSQRLLLAIPPLTLFMVMLHIGSSYRLSLIGRYIQKDLWPYIAERAGDPALPSWEAETAARQLSWKAFPAAIFMNFPAMAILIVVSVIALIHVGRWELLSQAGWFSVVAAIRRSDRGWILGTQDLSPRAAQVRVSWRLRPYGCCSTERMLPAGSLNQATIGPGPRAMPFSSWSKPS
jgi:hypothetical protein